MIKISKAKIGHNQIVINYAAGEYDEVKLTSKEYGTPELYEAVDEIFKKIITNCELTDKAAKGGLSVKWGEKEGLLYADVKAALVIKDYEMMIKKRVIADPRTGSMPTIFVHLEEHCAEYVTGHRAQAKLIGDDHDE